MKKRYSHVRRADLFHDTLGGYLGTNAVELGFKSTNLSVFLQHPCYAVLEVDPSQLHMTKLILYIVVLSF